MATEETKIGDSRDEMGDLKALFTEFSAKLPLTADQLRDALEQAFEIGYSNGHGAGWDEHAQATPMDF